LPANWINALKQFDYIIRKARIS